MMPRMVNRAPLLVTGMQILTQPMSPEIPQFVERCDEHFDPTMPMSRMEACIPVRPCSGDA